MCIRDRLTAAAFPAAGGTPPPVVAVYDGDTPQNERAAIRASVQLLITNPDMLHVSVLPFHTNFRRLLSNLRYVVVDEGHMYRGAFGCHVACVLRRLRRVCEREYGTSPTFVVASATSAEPARHARELLGVKDLRVVLRDGSPHGPRVFVLWNPPLAAPAAAPEATMAAQAEAAAAEAKAHEALQAAKQAAKGAHLFRTASDSCHSLQTAFVVSCHLQLRFTHVALFRSREEQGAESAGKRTTAQCNQPEAQAGLRGSTGALGSPCGAFGRRRCSCPGLTTEQRRSDPGCTARRPTVVCGLSAHKECL